MGLYEITAIVRQDLSQAQVTALTDEISALAEEQGGRVNKKEYWGLRSFAYRIRKARKGHYVYQEIEIAPAGLEEIDRILGLHENVLRHLIVRVEAFSPEATAMLTARPEKTDRPGGDRFDRPRRRDEGYRPRPEADAVEEDAA